jgi:hypothetical protein
MYLKCFLDCSATYLTFLFPTSGDMICLSGNGKARIPLSVILLTLNIILIIGTGIMLMHLGMTNSIGVPALLLVIVFYLVSIAPKAEDATVLDTEKGCENILFMLVTAIPFLTGIGCISNTLGITVSISGFDHPLAEDVLSGLLLVAILELVSGLVFAIKKEVLDARNKEAGKQ